MLQRFGLEEGGRVQKIIDKAVIDYSEPYWAFNTGTLAHSAHAATVYGSGKVIWPGPYAHYQAMGEVYGPNIWNEDGHVENAPMPYFSLKDSKKKPTGRKLKYKTDNHPLAGAFPIERMKADHTEDILEEIRTMMNDEL